jgi:hypothetical protein
MTAKSFLLLLGAGFSRNWGGWLASEADEYLLGYPKTDKPVRDLLWHYRRTGGFEAALAELQESNNASDSRLKNLLSALMQMFSDMDQAFQGIRFDFNNDIKQSISGFLSRFDAIFTLNQDLLLERHYLNDNIMLMSMQRWNGYTLPGMKPLAEGSEVDRNVGTWEPDYGALKILPRLQPYIKLHGSSNWREPSSGHLLVLGGNKPGIINKNPLLAFYHGEFASRLSVANTRLMVIGYSFNDDHINRTLIEAVKRGGLRIFIVDPMGTDVIDKNRNGAIYSPGELVVEIWPALIGASRRTLREIFGADRVEYEKLMRFFT